MAGLVSAPLHGGFNQNGGGYYIVLTSLTGAQILNYAGGSGSGGAYATGLVSTYSGIAGQGGPAIPSVGNFSTAFFGQGRLIKDMGKTVVSSGRTFRKFQAVVVGAAAPGNSSPTFGVNGPVGTTTVPGYMTAYLEIGREGAGATGAGVGGLPLIARYA